MRQNVLEYIKSSTQYVLFGSRRRSSTLPPAEERGKTFCRSGLEYIVFELKLRGLSVSAVRSRSTHLTRKVGDTVCHEAAAGADPTATPSAGQMFETVRRAD